MNFKKQDLSRVFITMTPFQIILNSQEIKQETWFMCSIRQNFLSVVRYYQTKQRMHQKNY